MGKREMDTMKSCPLRVIGVVAAMLVGFLVIAGCATSTITKTSSGLLYEDAVKKSLLLEPNMSRDAVKALLGPPSSTEANTYGQNLGTPWQGILWRYVFVNQDGSYYSGKLEIVFHQVSPGEWAVNNWNW